MSVNNIQDPAVREVLDKILSILEDPREGITKIIESCLRNESEITELKNQIGINCTKLDSMDKKLDSIVEIVTANGQGIEVISERVDTLELHTN